MGNADSHTEKVIEGKFNFPIGSPQFIEMTKWPVMLIDTTGSMNEGASASSASMSRADLVKEVCRRVVYRLSPVDDAERQQTNFKGVPLVTFNEVDGGVDRGFLHYQNFDAEWSNVAFHGGTHIMQGWHKMLEKYQQNFSDNKDTIRPLLLCLIITDGELRDGHEFEKHLKHVHGKAFVEIAVIGFGEDHDRACQHYVKISATHPHVRYTQFSSVNEADKIVDQLVSMIDPRLVKPATFVPTYNVPLEEPPAYAQAGNYPPAFQQQQ